MQNEIKYFSMFTGVGGFELGISRSNRNVGSSSEEENISNSKGDKSISQRQQEEFNNTTDNRETQSSKDSSGALFQNGQEQSNTFSSDLESTKGDIEFRQQIRQTSNGILREGNGIRDDKKSMELGKDSSNIEQFQCVGFSEIDKYANELLTKRFPNIPNFGDCTKIEADKLPDFDMLCGGFPCQSFSIAGKRRGFEDTRGTMFFHIARILEVKRPKIVFLENVKGLLNHDKGKTFQVIIQTLSELGYDVQWMVLNSKFFGVPQNRERVFIIGSLRGEPRPEILPFRRNYEESNEQNKTTRQIIQVDDVARENKNKFGDRLKMDGTSFTLNNIEQRGIIIGTLDTNGWEKRHEQIRRVWDTSGTAPTIPTAQGGGVMTKIAVQPVQLVNKNRAEKPYNPNNREMKLKIRDDETSYTVKETTHEFMVAIQSHSPKTNDPKKGGSGPLISDEHCFTIDSTPHNVIMDLYNNKEHSDRSPALTEPHHNTLRVREGMKIRRLTPTECERLQGFPDGWTEGFSDTQRYKMMGNAITVNVVKAIGEKLIK